MLREMQKEDLMKTWTWINHPEVRHQSLKQDPIPFPEHEAWFRDLKKNGIHAYIYSDGGYDLGACTFNENTHAWSYYKNMFRSPRGTGSKMCQEFLDHLTNKVHVTSVIGIVKEENTKSRAIHEKLGFLMSVKQGNKLYYEFIA